MTRQYELDGGEFISLKAESIPDDIWSKIALFQTRIKSLYLLKQEGKYGIKSLGSEIRGDEEINSIFDTIHQGSLLVKSTRNRSEVERLHVRTIERCLEEKISSVYYIMFSPELKRSSRIFDATSIVLDNWVDSISRMNKLFYSKVEVNVRFIELNNISGCYFECHPIKSEFSRIKLSKNV
jgi:hypothetical protein